MMNSSYAVVRLLTLTVCLYMGTSDATSVNTQNSTAVWHSPGVKLSRTSKNGSEATSNIISPTSSTSSHVGRLGAFIASGTGMLGSTNAAGPGIGEIARTSFPDATTQSNGSLFTAPATIQTTSGTSLVANASSQTSNHGNFSHLGDCFDQWNSYWTASNSHRFDVPYSISATLITATVPHTDYSFDWSVTASESLLTTTITGPFAPTPLETVQTIALPGSTPVSTYETETVVNSILASVPIDLLVITSPACVLPTYLAVCQSSWDSWISTPFPYGGSAPSCTQAIVTGSYCAQTISEFLSFREHWYGQVDGVLGGQMVTSGDLVYNGTISTTSLYWPASEELVPGCTVGCQSCQINGGTVKLLYWPPESSTWVNGLYSAITDSSTEISTLVTLGTTLTSPTVYVSFDSLYARDSCSAFGKTYYNEIVAITNAATLSSIFGFSRENRLGATASFNFTDLYVTPVPEQIYQSQPRCAYSFYLLGGGPQWNGWVCPRLYPYEPILAIPTEVRTLDPDWINCIGSINGVYDPPVALTPADAIPTPTLMIAVSVVTNQASPESTPKPTIAPVTSASQAQTSTKTTSLKTGSRPSADMGADTGMYSASRVEDETAQHGSTGSRPMRESDQPGMERPGPDVKLSASFTDSDPPVTIDALSALLAAQSFVEATEPHPADGHSQSTLARSGPPAESHVPTTSEPDPVIIFIADDGLATTYVADSSRIIAQDGLPAGTRRGSEITVGTDVFVDPSGGINVGNTVTHAVLATANRSPGNPFYADAQLITASKQGSVVVFAGGAQTLTAHAGGAITIGSQVIRVNNDASGIMIGSATIGLPSKANDKTLTAGAVWKADGSRFAAIMQDMSTVVRNSDTTSTTRADVTATIASGVLNVLSDGNAIVSDENGVASKPAGDGGPDHITTLLQDGHTLRASTVGDLVILQQGSSKITLAVGQQGTVGGEVVSIAQDSVILVNGSEIVSMPLRTSSTVRSPSEHNAPDPKGTPYTIAKATCSTGETAGCASSLETDSVSGSSSGAFTITLDAAVLVTCVLILTSLL